MSDGSVVVNGQSHAQVEGFLAPLGDWAVMKGAGAGEPLVCKRGNGETATFTYAAGTWAAVRSEADIPLPWAIEGVPEPVRSRPAGTEKRAPRSTTRKPWVEFWKHTCELGRGQVWLANKTVPITADFELNAGGLILVGNESYSASDNIPGVEAGALRLYRPRGRDLLVVETPSGIEVFHHVGNDWAGCVRYRPTIVDRVTFSFAWAFHLFCYVIVVRGLLLTFLFVALLLGPIGVADKLLAWAVSLVLSLFCLFIYFFKDLMMPLRIFTGLAKVLYPPGRGVSS